VKGRLRGITTIAVTVIGIALIDVAFAANQRWLDQHFLPSFFLTRSEYVRIEWVVRLGIGIVGISVALIAPFVARFLTSRILRLAISMGIAAVLALVAGQAGLGLLIGLSVERTFRRAAGGLASCRKYSPRQQNESPKGHAIPLPDRLPFLYAKRTRNVSGYLRALPNAVNCSMNCVAMVPLGWTGTSQVIAPSSFTSF